MKSKHRKRSTGARFAGILQSFTSEQLKWIGAVAMAFNEAEAVMHRVFGACINFPENTEHISSRIGIGNLPTLVMLVAPRFGLDDAVVKIIERTLVGEGFTQMKSWRDGVIHARLMDMSSGWANAPDKGDYSSVLLAEAALEGLYHRLAIVKDELDEIETILSAGRLLAVGRVKDDQHKVRLEESIRSATAQCLQHQKRRQSLPPLPKFPEEPDILQLTPHKREPPVGKSRQN